MKYAEKLARLLELRDVSQSWLARQTGIAQTAISDMTLEKRRPYGDQAFAIARALGTTADYMLDEQLDEEPQPPAPMPPDEYSVLSNYRALKELGVSDQQVVNWMVAMKAEMVRGATKKPSGGGETPVKEKKGPIKGGKQVATKDLGTTRRSPKVKPDPKDGDLAKRPGNPVPGGGRK